LVVGWVKVSYSVGLGLTLVFSGTILNIMQSPNGYYNTDIVAEAVHIAHM